jgi:lipopolysaccharide/colanic/teichoic acid biosynthesis glycosyltransferase
MNLQDHRHTDVKNLFTPMMSGIPAWKRIIDLTCCLIALPVLCLISGVMAIYLRFISRGPVLFKQERVGYNGSRFMCYKFRTMRAGADTKSHQAYLDNLMGSRTPMVKLDAKGDSRMIPGAWILRATGLDELPQVINIYRREMSIVGPRPCIPYEYEKYELAQRKRFDAVPGLTGLWQVSGKNRTTFEEMVALDIKYTVTSSFWLDVGIILKTVPALITQVIDTRMARISSTPARTHVVYPHPHTVHPSGRPIVKRAPQILAS